MVSAQKASRHRNKNPFKQPILRIFAVQMNNETKSKLKLKQTVIIIVLGGSRRLKDKSNVLIPPLKAVVQKVFIGPFMLKYILT